MASAPATSPPEPATAASATLGRLAHAVLCRPGFRARVIAAGRSAIYLQSADGAIVWLAPSGGVRHRRAILLEGRLPALVVGSAVHVVAGRLVAGDHVLTDVERASVWRARSARIEPAATKLLVSRTRSAAHSALGHARDAPLLAAICARWLNERSGRGVPHSLDPFALRALPALSESARALCRDRYAPLAGLVERLIGFGPGLTPSGDDVLGGLLFALTGTGRDCSDLIGPDEHRTHPISLAIVRDLACGYGPEPLQQLADEVFAPHGAGPAPATIAAVAAIGHRSGRDLLSGFLAGLCAAQSRSAIDPASQARSPVWLKT